MIQIHLVTEGDISDAEELVEILEGDARKARARMDRRGARLLNKLRDALTEAIEDD